MTKSQALEKGRQRGIKLAVMYSLIVVEKGRRRECEGRSDVFFDGEV